MRRTSIVVALAAALSLTLAACGGDGNGDAAGTDVTVVATEFAFDPPNLTIPADTNVTITIDNQGVVEHDLVVDELGIEIYADPGTSTSDTVNVPAGTYVMYCSIPGHRESGMEGTFTVTG